MSDETSRTHELPQAELLEYARRLEERNAELKRTNEELRHADQVRSDLVSMVSHELRTPLATIKEFTSILADGLAGQTTPDQQEYLRIIQGNVERMIRLIDDLLDSAKIEAGRVLLNKRLIEARPLIEQVLQSMEPLTSEKRLRVDLRIPDGPFGVYADLDKILQVLTNLVSNAVRFTPEGGQVTVDIQELDNEIQFLIEDTGIGIEPENLPKLFQKFQQFQASVGGRAFKGTGLGLAISKRLVELHGGRIWAESRVGAGSRFFFTLPKYHVEEVVVASLKTGVEQAKQRQSHFSIIMLAIREFNELKARYDLEGVAQLLKAVERLVQETIRRRSGDVIVRWQHGDMIVILAEVDKGGCQAIGERLKRVVERQPFRVRQAEERVHIEIRSVTYPEDSLNEEEFLRLAERCLEAVSRPKLHILVVDDEQKIRQFMKEVLELRDFTVHTAASGPEALERLKQQRVDLILLDLVMPVMDGYQVYHLLKETPKTRDIPVLIVTAKGERTDRLLGMDSPTYNYLTKPFELAELLGKIQALLQRVT